jgi:hypothetical protein
VGVDDPWDADVVEGVEDDRRNILFKLFIEKKVDCLNVMGMATEGKVQLHFWVLLFASSRCVSPMMKRIAIATKKCLFYKINYPKLLSKNDMLFFLKHFSCDNNKFLCTVTLYSVSLQCREKGLVAICSHRYPYLHLS